MRFSLVVLAGFMLVACSKSKVLSVEELRAFILDERNGLRKTVEVNDYRVEVFNRPTDLWVHQEVGQGVVNDTTLELLRGKYDSYYYFIVSLSRNNKEALHNAGGGMEKYSELVQTMSFRMSQYANLTTNTQDTIPVGDFMLNRTFGISASTDLVFVFSKEEINEQEWIQFNLNEFGMGLGNQRFRFDRKDIDSAPRISFETRASINE